jgi:hypothetical protein
LTILVLAGLSGTISKAQSNFPNANIVTCGPTVDDCSSELIDDAGDSYAGLYGTFDFSNSNVYALTDPQLVPLGALIRRDDCPTDMNTSSGTVALSASVAMIALIAALLAL